MKGDTIAVAMSGGVDSSAAAALLCAEGRDIVGLTMQLWDQRRLADPEGVPEQTQGRCCSTDDVHDARRVAELLEIPYYVVNQQQRFEDDVVRPFVDEYLSGRTPVPCSLCNNHLKFDQLLNTARQIGAEKLATGHYARNSFDQDLGRWLLRKPMDKSKDQTYFLAGLTQEQLSRTIFPLGEMLKSEVREAAKERLLPVADKADSQEICFIPGGDYKKFIGAYLADSGEVLPDTSGNMVTSTGEVLARHAGVHNYTVGQRKGLGIAQSSPLYVIEIRGVQGEVVLGHSEELYRSILEAKDVNWISIERLLHPRRVKAKIRHRHEAAASTIQLIENGNVLVKFDEPQRAVAPGQGVVFYDEEVVVGGGWIV